MIPKVENAVVTDEQIHTALKIMLNKYMSSFVDDEKFQDKRFNRYVGKITDILYYYFTNILCNEARTKTIHNYVDGYADYFDYLIDDEEVDILSEFGYDLLNKKITKQDDVQFRQFLKALIREQKNPLNITFQYICEQAVRVECMEIIRQGAAKDCNITNANYFKTIPDAGSDIMQVYFNVLMSIEKMLIRLYYMSKDETVLKEYKNDEIKELKNTINQKVQDYEKLEESAKSYSQRVSALEKQLESKDKIKEDAVKNLTTENKLLESENIKLKHRVAELEELLRSNSDDNEEEKKSTNGNSNNDIDNIDYNAKYVFVMHENKDYAKAIKKVFPNAVFYDDNAELSSNIYMVISITSYVSHVTYNYFKKQCELKNIPFLHCIHTNIEIIKQLIADNIK